MTTSKILIYADLEREILPSFSDRNRAAGIVQSVGPKLYSILTSHIPEKAFTDHDYGDEFEFICFPDREFPAEEIVAALAEHRPAGLITSAFTPLRSESIYDKMHEVGLSAVATRSVGIDHLNIPCLTKQGISLYNTPDVLNEAVAVHTLGLILALANNAVRGDAFVKSGDWTARGIHAAQVSLATSDLFTWTIGIIGLGRISTQVLTLLASFGPDILWTDTDPDTLRRAAEIEEMYCRLAAQRGHKPTVGCVDLDDLLERSDLVTVHTSLNPSTEKLLDQRNFSKMKEGAYFVNVARGGVTDYDALYLALESGHLAGAGLDVFPQEPVSDPVRQRLQALPNVMTTPHVASNRVQTRTAMSYLACYSLLARLAGYSPTNIVSPEVDHSRPDK